jgi:hypothetical protein
VDREDWDGAPVHVLEGQRIVEPAMLAVGPVVHVPFRTPLFRLLDQGSQVLEELFGMVAHGVTRMKDYEVIPLWLKALGRDACPVCGGTNLKVASKPLENDLWPVWCQDCGSARLFCGGVVGTWARGQGLQDRPY